MRPGLFRWVLLGLVFLLPLPALAAPTFHANRAAFNTALNGLTTFVDDYNSGYQFVQSDAAMTAVRNKVIYQATGFANNNIVSGGVYCAGCNGSFRLTFTNFSATGSSGVGMDVPFNSGYFAFITFGDNTTANVAVTGTFFGVTAPERIKSIHFGLTGGGTTLAGNFGIDNITVANLCAADADCPSNANTCQRPICSVSGVCGFASTNENGACNDGNACTQGETCKAGVCTPASVTSCSAADACHVAGVCNPATGACSNPAKPDGSSCSDSNSCTQSDTCQAGACTAGAPVVCPPPDQCHEVGVCDPTTGVCSNVPKADGTACDDGNACTPNDTCQAGACIGGGAITCAASDQCHDAGVCNPATGQCSDPPKADGTACNDGDACTLMDTCQAGTCTGASSITCNALDQCHDAGTCNPATGECSNPNKADGVTCDDGDACTQSDTCQAGACVGANPTVCSATDACHDTGTCDPTTGLCDDPVKPDGASCSTNNSCVNGDSCQAGVCTAGVGVTCMASDQCHEAGVCDMATGQCSNPLKADGAACDDGDACTQNDTCQMGVCQGGGQLFCMPIDECHEAGTCNMSGGACTTPAKPDGAPCTGGACNGGVCIPMQMPDGGPGMDMGPAGMDMGPAGMDMGGRTDAGGRRDASVSADRRTGNGAVSGGGCSCNVNRSLGANDLVGLAFLVGLALFLRRRQK